MLNKTTKKQRLAIFDVDGTIFRENLLFELIDTLVYLGIFRKEVRRELIETYGDWLNHEGTYEVYRNQLVKLYAENIRGCSQQEVVKAAKNVASFNAKRTYIFTRDLIEKLQKEYLMFVISGSPIEIVEEYAKILKFDVCFGSVYEIDEKGFYTGMTVFEPTLNKGEVVKQFMVKNSVTLKNSFGIGDTESDAKFLELVDEPVAFNPNHNLKEIAQKKGWKIVVEKKDVIYEI